MSRDASREALTLKEKFRALYRVVVYRPQFAIGTVTLSIIAAVLEGIGLSFLIPVIEIAQGTGGRSETSRIGEAFVTAYETIGIPFTLETVIGGVAVVMVVRYMSSFFVTWLRAALQTDYIRYLQSEGFRHALAADVSYYDEHGSDEILNAIVTQSEYASQTIQHGVKITQQGFLALMYLSITLYIAPVLTLVAGVVLGGILYLLRRTLESGYAVGDRVADANERAQEVVQAGTQGIREVKLFGLESELFNRFETVIDQFARSQIRLRRNKGVLDNVYEMITAITVFLLIYLALRLASLSLASLGIFLFAVFRLAPRVSNLSNVLYDLDGSLPHLVRMQEFIDELRYKHEIDDGTEMPPSTIQHVSFDDVTFSYGEEQILDGLSFSVERGEFIAFVGPSGAGKSTIVSLLGRLYEPDSGKIIANGKPIDEFVLEHWRERISVVRQQPYMFNDTLRYNVTLGRRDASEERIKQVCETAQVTEFIEDLPNGLDTVLGDDGVRLSGGQRQRVAIARALLKPSDVLVLDEATSDLDNEIERDVHEAIEANSNRAMIVIAHRLSTVTEADRICVIDQGTVEESGTHSELLAQDGLYYDLYT